MPAPRRKNLIASRRRRQDDGEEEGSFVGDLDDDSLSEGSAATNGEGDEAAESEFSEDERELSSPTKTTTSVPARQRQKTRDGASSPDPQPKHTDPSTVDPDAQATLQDPNTDVSSQNSAKIQLNGLAKSTEEPLVPGEATVSLPPRHETFAQRSRREHQEYIQQRNANPAFVPTRGGFFLHDDRSGASNGHNRGAPRGRGRAYGPAIAVSGYVYYKSPPTISANTLTDEVPAFWSQLTSHGHMISMKDMSWHPNTTPPILRIKPMPKRVRMTGLLAPMLHPIEAFHSQPRSEMSGFRSTCPA